MKKIILTSVVCSFMAISCLRNDDDNNKPVIEPPVEHLILGKWKLTEKQLIRSRDGETVEFDLTNEEGGCQAKNFDEYTRDGKYIRKEYFKEEDSEDCREQVWESRYNLDNPTTLEIKDLVHPKQKILKLNEEQLVIKTLGHDFDEDGKEDYRIYTYKRIK